MIVFNITAAICGVFIAALVIGLRQLLPGMTEPAGYFSMAAIVIAVGGVAEWADLRPRVFWIPLHICGALMALLGVLHHAGPLVFWPLLAALAVAFYVQRRFAARRATQQALERGAPQRDLRL